MRTEHKGFVITVYSWGDSITPMYEYSLYKPRKNWFPKRVWRESIHRRNIAGKVTEEFDRVINNYLEEQERWIR